MTEEQIKHSEQRHGAANEMFLRRLEELGWLVSPDSDTCVDKECDVCENACKRKE